MVRLKKTHSQIKMTTYQVGLRINTNEEEECEMYFPQTGKIKLLIILYENKDHDIILHLKDVELLNNEEIDVLKLQENRLNSINTYNIRFGSLSEKEDFISTGFSDRIRDSGESSSSTPSPPVGDM